MTGVLVGLVVALSYGLLLLYGVNGMARGLNRAVRTVNRALADGVPAAIAAARPTPPAAPVDPAFVPYPEPERCRCSQRGEPVEVHSRWDPLGPLLVVNVVCSKCWSVDTRAESLAKIAPLVDPEDAPHAQAVGAPVDPADLDGLRRERLRLVQVRTRLVGKAAMGLRLTREEGHRIETIDVAIMRVETRIEVLVARRGLVAGAPVRFDRR